MDRLGSLPDRVMNAWSTQRAAGTWVRMSMEERVRRAEVSRCWVSLWRPGSVAARLWLRAWSDSGLGLTSGLVLTPDRVLSKAGVLIKAWILGPGTD